MRECQTTPDASLDGEREPSSGAGSGRGSSEAWVGRTRGRWQWRIDPKWLHLFDDVGEPDWLDLAADPRAERVKGSEGGREVFRVRAGEVVLYAKLFRPVGWWGWLRRQLAGSDAARERRITEYARSHGIGAVEPVATAEAAIRGREVDSIYITLGREEVRPLEECWQQLACAAAGQRRLKNAVIDAVAELLARAHQNGFEHFDLHASNVLIRTRCGEYRALFVDLHDIRTGRRVSDAGIVRNLAQLNQWFSWHATVSDRVRFLERYVHWHREVRGAAACGRELRGDRRGLIEALEWAIRRHANALYARRDRRLLRTGSYFARLDLPDGWRAHTYLACKHPMPGSRVSRMIFTGQQWREWLGEPAAWFTPTDRSRVIKDSTTAIVCRQRLDAGEGEPLEVVCKRSRPRNPLKLLRYALLGSRPMLTWKKGNALLHRRIPTARPLAVLERRRFGLVLDSFVITEYLEDGHDLDSLLVMELRALPADRERRVKLWLSQELARLVRLMHGQGFVHRDFKAPNIMVQWSPISDDLPRLSLVDLDGLRQVRRPTEARQLRAIARLNVSLDHCRGLTRTDRLRFLKQYLRRPGRPDPEWKPCWQAIASSSGSIRTALGAHQRKRLRRPG